MHVAVDRFGGGFRTSWLS